MEGFLLPDYADEWPNARRELVEHFGTGSIKPLENVVDGLDRAPQALIDLLAGRNVGKTMVRVGLWAGQIGRKITRVKASARCRLQAT